MCQDCRDTADYRWDEGGEDPGEPECESWRARAKAAELNLVSLVLAHAAETPSFHDTALAKARELVEELSSLPMLQEDKCDQISGLA